MSRLNSYFKDEFFNAIAADLFDEDNAVITENGVIFKLLNLFGNEQFTAIGSISLEDRFNDEDINTDFLDLSLVLAKDLDENLIEEIGKRLYEINATYKSGVFFVDNGGNLCFESAFPILTSDVEASAALFTTMFEDVREVISGIFPYLLRVVVTPEDCNFAEYVQALTAL